MAMPPKRKISLSLDADLVDELEHDADDGLSSQVNVVLRAEVERRRRQRALRVLLDRLGSEDGPLTADDEAEIQRFEQALGSDR
jgi:antitoxin CcdA